MPRRVPDLDAPPILSYKVIDWDDETRMITIEITMHNYKSGPHTNIVGMTQIAVEAFTLFCDKLRLSRIRSDVHFDPVVAALPLMERLWRVDKNIRSINGITYQYNFWTRNLRSGI